MLNKKIKCKKDITFKIICISIILITVNVILGINYIYATSNKGIANIVVSPIINELTQDAENNKIYRAKAANETTEVDVNVTTVNKNASVEISGNRRLQVGTNKILVKVTEQDGTSETYTIYVRRTDTPIASENIISNIQEENEAKNNNVQENVTEPLDNNSTEILNNNNETIDNKTEIDEKNAIIDDVKNENVENLTNNQKTNITKSIGIGVILGIMIIAIIIVIKNKNNKKG